ncbi:RNA polymerase II-binding domain-containing protein [Xylariaceae sp. FL0804]|nr:RNA polymerase II-binding domain-containing protein [Xylariaceae sp. FL0804]
MSYNDDAVLAKLSALAETQDSIVTVAQWIMFHRRHAERTVQLWLQKLKDSSSHKRLNLIYLSNEVCQQSKARHKEEFLVAFSPSIAEGVATAYKGAPQDIQQRIRRVVDVWRERGVFEAPIQEAVEARIQDVDKARGTAKAGFGGSIFGSSASLPSELAPLMAPQQNVSKLLLTTKTAVGSANQDYDKLMGPGASVPSAPVYAARLSGLLKTLAQAEGAVEQCVKARRDLVNELQKILDANRTALIADEDQLETFMQRKGSVEDKKNEVERAIMAGLPNDEPYNPGTGLDELSAPEPDRPEVEALTPPPAESAVPQLPPDVMADDEEWSPELPQEATFPHPAVPGVEVLSNLATQHKSVHSMANGAKKRRLDDGNDFPDLGGDDGIEADVVEMLRRESSGS